MKRNIFIGISVLFLCILFSFPSVIVASEKDTPADGWKVGTARVDITPDSAMWMAGYAARTRPAAGTLQRLWAKAIAFEDAAGQRGVLITTDLLGFPRTVSDTIRTRLQERLRLSRAQIILNSSHTHSGPVLRDAMYHIYPIGKEEIWRIERYTSQLEDQIVRMVERAFHRMRPVRIRFGTGVVRFAVNRRENRADELKTSTALTGPSDYAVPVLKITGNEDNLPAVVFSYACHATTLSGYEWSGDYPGFAMSALEQRYPGTLAMFAAGAGADQNPLPRRSVPLARQYGRELAVAVERVLEESMTELNSELKTAYEEIPLELTTPPDTSVLKEVIASREGYQARWAKIQLNKHTRGERFRTQYPYPVQIWRLGDLLIVALGGEVVADYAVRLKRLFGQEAVVLAYSNDVMGYIPSVRILREGGYEGTVSQRVYGLPSPWTADIEQKIISAVLRLAKETGIKMPEATIE